MRTIVVFVAGDKLLYNDLADYPTVPQRGFVLEHEGVAYTVKDVWLSPLVFENNGDKKRSGFSKLFALMSRLYAGKPVTVADLIAKMDSIGSGDRPQKSAGGIELPKNNNLLPQFDDVILLNTEASSGSAKRARDTSLSAMRLLAVSSPQHAAACGFTGNGKDNIVLTADAEK